MMNNEWYLKFRSRKLLKVYFQPGCLVAYFLHLHDNNSQNSILVATLMSPVMPSIFKL